MDGEGLMRRALWIITTAAVLILATVGVSWASQGSSNVTIDLISRASTINDFVDIGPTGFGPGDVYVFSDRLFLTTAPNDQIGRSDGRCVLIDPATFRFDCSGTISLPEGDLMIAGALTLVEGTTSVGAIVGGTAAYRKARGEATVELGPFEGPHDVTLDVVLNP
jgi:hypothetical protein